MIVPQSVPELGTDTPVPGRITGRAVLGERTVIATVPNTTDIGTPTPAPSAEIKIAA
jgi:hypothetical protein